MTKHYAGELVAEFAWACGFGVTFGGYAAGRLSGAHLNSAVTVALAGPRLAHPALTPRVRSDNG